MFAACSRERTRQHKKSVGTQRERSGTMAVDLCELLRNDHDDLDRALAAMVDPITSPRELSNLLEVVQLALAVHSAAEARILELMLQQTPVPRSLGLVAGQVQMEHAAQRGAAAALDHIRPGSIGWYSHAHGLRRLVVDHAERSDWQHIPPIMQRTLAAEYATERMRVLGTAAPLAVADRRERIQLN